MYCLRFVAIFSLLLPVFALCISCSSSPDDIGSKFAEWRKGVWILQDGSYAVYTDNHYFVIYASGDSAAANLYCGASQIEFHNKGMARKQVIRIRQFPGGELNFSKKSAHRPDNTETPLKIDTTLFAPNTCNIKDGIIYDSITEITDEYILLATCNGDKEKIFSNGVAVYLPAGGGEAYSYRVEKL